MQLTHKSNHDEFLASIPDASSGANTAKHIADNYPWESAAWFWAVQTKGDGVVLNNYVATHGAEENVFLVTQYFVGGYLDKDAYPFFNSDMSDIRKGAAYTYNLTEKWVDNKGNAYTGTISINSRKYRLPQGYAERQKKYNESVVFK